MAHEVAAPKLLRFGAASLTSGWARCVPETRLKDRHAGTTKPAKSRRPTVVGHVKSAPRAFDLIDWRRIQHDLVTGFYEPGAEVDRQHANLA